MDQASDRTFKIHPSVYKTTAVFGSVFLSFGVIATAIEFWYPRGSVAVAPLIAYATIFAFGVLLFLGSALMRKEGLVMDARGLTFRYRKKKDITVPWSDLVEVRAEGTEIAIYTKNDEDLSSGQTIFEKMLRLRLGKESNAGAYIPEAMLDVPLKEVVRVVMERLQVERRKTGLEN